MGIRRTVIRRLALLAVLIPGAGAAAPDCQDTAVTLRGDWGSARFTVEIADDPDERAQGLMHRPSMPSGAGMLFVYEGPQSLTFWMRNTLIELDMLFIDPQGVVRHIHHRAQPLDETTIPGGDGLLAVLEINGGLAKRLGITEGTEMRHPAFAANDPAWPC